MGGTTKRYDTTPAQTSKLRGGIVDYLMGGSGGGGPSGNFTNPATAYQKSVMDGSGASGFGTQGYGTGSPYDRINARTVAPTDSVDTLGGADSPFFKNMMAQYAPAFAAKRATAIAAAKEGSGTLTGSGNANAIGMAINRSLGDENLATTGIAQYGLSQEMARQQNRYNQQMDSSRSDASNFLQLLMGQGLAGVSPDTIRTGGGIMSLFGPLMKLYGMYKGSQTTDTSGGGTTDGDGSPSSGSGGPFDPFA